jgi:amino acid adenylation domain-containing protein
MNATHPIRTLVEAFADTAARYPDRPAVSDGTRSLSYAELDHRSSAFGLRLAGRGVRVEDRVVVHLPRSVDVFVAILGVLKAGAAYVPVDERYPDARRDLMIDNCGAALVVTSPSLARRLRADDRAVLEWHGELGDGPGTPLAVGARPENAASVLFTSGSSGTPKAIVLEHRNLVSFATNPALPQLLPDDRVGQISSVSFDAFHFEAWCSLAQGAEVVVLPSLTDLLAADPHRALRRHRISALLVPTMAFNHLMREDREAFSSLRVLHTGGDVLLPAACRDLLSSQFKGQFVNLYGPSETTTASTAHPVTEVVPDGGSVPIGEPLDGTTAYVLDHDLALVEKGQIGELYLGGCGVARGYLGQPHLTASRFLPDPFAGPGHRMYATGDLARERPDGKLEFIGRADDQVKIRGYRVEPGEVERALCRHPEVREAAVLAAGDGNDRWLVAFVASDEVLSPRKLRTFMQEVLPDYLVPSEFIAVPEIPATEHGKRDRDALGTLLLEHQRRRERHLPLEGEVERYLAQLWEDLLGAEHIGAGDDFFLLGGHSMLALRVQRNVRRDLGVRLEFRDVLDNGVLRDLAGVIQLQRDGDVR